MFWKIMNLLAYVIFLIIMTLNMISYIKFDKYINSPENLIMFVFIGIMVIWAKVGKIEFILDK